MNETSSAEKDAAYVRGTHPYHFRSGEWARIVAQDTRADGRPITLVAFPDGTTDTWVTDDATAGYEYRPAEQGQTDA